VPTRNYAPRGAARLSRVSRSANPQPLGIGFNKNNPALVARVDGALAEMKRDGTYARLTHKWGVP
jgi:aspartate/glutamate/glutamine transport system substrate-binding protein